MQATEQQGVGTSTSRTSHVVMLCAGCMKAMQQLESGAYVACCKKGYWANLAPLVKDSWWSVEKRNGLYLYQRILGMH